MTEPVPKLGALYINPAGGCNLDCVHCWVNQGEFKGELLSLNQWEHLILQAGKLGCSYLKLTGGEPLLYENIVPLFSYAAENIQRVSIETNGTLEPSGLWNAFELRKPYHVSVSIDSAEPVEHDSFRGMAGSWEKAVNFSGRIVRMKIPSQIVMSITDTRRDPIRKMIALASDIGVDTLRINLVTPSGKGSENNFFTDMDIQKVLDFFSWLSDETPLWVLPAIPAALLPVKRLRGLGYCPVRKLMGVLPDGTYSLCGVAFSKNEMAWGRFPETTVRDAWLNSPIYRKIRDSVPNRLQGVCGRCIHKDTCSGRCVVNNMETSGCITSPDLLCQKAYEAGLFPRTRLVDENG